MMTLTDPTLGTLVLHGDNPTTDPFIVAGFTIGSLAVRPVMRTRALSNGQLDDTRFTGGRAVTVAIRLNEKYCGPLAGDTMQDLLDRLLPYMNPRRRPVLTYTLPGSDGSPRQLTVRGDSAPVQIAGSKHQAVVLSMISPDGEITTAGDPVCIDLNPAGDVELGRVYPAGTTDPGNTAGRVYPAGTTEPGNVAGRVYPASLAIGDRVYINAGNEEAHWILQIFGGCTNPFFTINGVTVNFNNNGGLVLPVGASVIIDTREQTIRLNGNPADPRYSKTNFTAWSWSDLMLKPGENPMRFGASVIGTGQARFCSLPTWAG